MTGIPPRIVEPPASVLSGLETDMPNAPTAQTQKASVKPVVNEEKTKSQLSLFG